MINSFLFQIKKLDKFLAGIVLTLSGIGLLSLYSTSQRMGFYNFEKQVFFLILGTLLMVLISFFDWRGLKNNPYLLLFLYLFFLFLLGGLFLFGKTIRGVKSWYKLGFFSFEPIDFMELVIIMILAKYFSLRHIELYRIRHIIISGVYVVIPSFLVFLQPDLGSVIILLGIWIFILLVSGIRLKHFLILLLLFSIAFSFSWHFLLKDYQKERVVSFLEPHLFKKTSGWSQRQSKIAIGSGFLVGKGFRRGTQSQYGFLPEVQTDFIFASFAEEFGFLGVIFLFFLFAVFFGHLFKIASGVRSNFSRLFILGFSFLVAEQLFINIGMNLGILPIIGIPLPFISYGGSNLLMLFIGLGIIQSMHVY